LVCLISRMFFFILYLSIIYGTRIHTNQHESRAYTRLLFRLIAGSRGTLSPSQSARAFWAYFYRPSRLRGRKHPCAGSAISRKSRRRRGCDSCWLVWIRVPSRYSKPQKSFTIYPHGC
jgi:hypothetical protein